MCDQIQVNSDILERKSYIYQKKIRAFVRLYSDPAGSCGSRVHRAMIFSDVGKSKATINKHHFHCIISMQLKKQ